MAVFWAGQAFAAVSSAADGSAEQSGLKSLARKKWTIMVYMSNRNNLASVTMANIAELESVGSSENFNVVIERARVLPKEGEYGPVERLYIQKSVPKEKSQSIVLQSRPGADLGDWKEARDFVDFSKNNFPAEKYLLIIWNHGSGWASDGKKPIEGTSGKTRGIAFDDVSDNHITTIELAALLEAAGGVDVFASDACFMADIAVNTEIAPYTRYIVASQEMTRNFGYDYARILNKFDKNPDMSAEGAAVALVDSFAEFYDWRPYLYSQVGLTMSAIRADVVEPLNRELKKFTAMAMQSKDSEAVKKAFKKANVFSTMDAVDLYDFLSILKKNTSDAKLAYECEKIMGYVSHRLVVKNLARGRHSGVAHGVSVYMPHEMYNLAYDKLLFTKETNWYDFTHYLFKLTKKPR